MLQVLLLVGVSFYVALAFGPSLWLIVSGIGVGWERWRARRRRRGVPAADFATTDSRSQSQSHASICTCFVIALPPLAFLLGAWQYQRGGWAFAEQVLAISTVCCAIFWLRLRRRGTRHAEVYAMSIWIFICLVWSALIALDGPASFGTRWSIRGGTIIEDYGISNLFGGKTLTVISAAWALTVTVLALVLARLRQPPVNPLPVISLALPYVCVFWFTEAMGWFHMALTIAVIGYAISREVRRIQDDYISQRGDTEDGKVIDNHSANPNAAKTRISVFRICVAVSVTVLTIAVGSVLPQFSSIDVGYRFAILGITLLATVPFQAWLLRRTPLRPDIWKWIALHLVVSMAVSSAIYTLTASPPNWFGYQVAATGGIALVVFVTLALRGHDTRYGAMLLGSIFMLILVYTFDTHGTGTLGPPWSVAQFAGTSVAAVATLVMMWRVLGPGTVEPPQTTLETEPESVGQQVEARPQRAPAVPKNESEPVDGHY